MEREFINRTGNITRGVAFGSSYQKDAIFGCRLDRNVWYGQ